MNYNTFWSFRHLHHCTNIQIIIHKERKGWREKVEKFDPKASKPPVTTVDFGSDSF